MFPCQKKKEKKCAGPHYVTNSERCSESIYVKCSQKEAEPKCATYSKKDAQPIYVTCNGKKDPQVKKKYLCRPKTPEPKYKHDDNCNLRDTPKKSCLKRCLKKEERKPDCMIASECESQSVVRTTKRIIHSKINVVAHETESDKKMIIIANPARKGLISHHAQVGECFRNMYTQDHLTDVVVIIESKPLNAHKAILIAHSEYFRDLLVDSDPHTHMELDIKGIPYIAFKVVLNYMYTAEVVLSIETLGDLYYTTNQLRIPVLFEKCEQMIKHISANDALIILETSYKKDTEICQRAFEKVVSCFVEIVDSPRLATQDLSMFLMIIACDSLVVGGEVDVFRAAMSWVRHDSRRLADASQIFSAIRFCYMTPREVLTCTEAMKELQTSLLKCLWFAVACLYKRQSKMPMLLPPRRQYRIDPAESMAHDLLCLVER